MRYADTENDRDMKIDNVSSEVVEIARRYSIIIVSWVCIHAYTRGCLLSVFVSVCVLVGVCVGGCVYMGANVCVCVCACMWVCEFVLAYMCLPMSVWEYVR